MKFKIDENLPVEVAALLVEAGHDAVTVHEEEWGLRSHHQLAATQLNARLQEIAMDPQRHWQKVYKTKKPTEVSWYQPAAELSLKMIRRATRDRSTAIIDVGGGASTLVDGLVAEAYSRVTVLDVSGAALAQASARLSDNADQVTWLEANVLEIELPAAAFDVWHDRAVFHFLTEISDRQRYVAQVRSSVRLGGYVVIATFATDGPTKCSGLDVARYSPQELYGQFGSEFQLLESAREEHHTPGGIIQPFIYCLFRVGTV